MDSLLSLCIIMLYEGLLGLCFLEKVHRVLKHHGVLLPLCGQQL
jgi:hypothetical protein